MTCRVFGVIQRYSPNKPVLVFSSTRKGCMYHFAPLLSSSLANQLLADGDRNGLSPHGFLRSAELQQGWRRVSSPT